MKVDLIFMEFENSIDIFLKSDESRGFLSC